MTSFGGWYSVINSVPSFVVTLCLHWLLSENPSTYSVCNDVIEYYKNTFLLGDLGYWMSRFKTPVALPILLPTGITSARSRHANG